MKEYGIAIFLIGYTPLTRVKTGFRNISRDILSELQHPQKSKIRSLMNKFLFILFPLLLSSVLYAQGLPNVDISLGSLSIEDSIISIGELKNITNRDGYDNQPSFSPDGKQVYFTSIRDTIQADIYRYDIEEDSTVQVTYTPESEYSPTMMPDENHISTVRVEKDSTQRLWKFNLDGTNPELILKTIKPVGYHCWIDTQQVALFVLGEPVLLLVVNTHTEKPGTYANNIGRSLHMIPGMNSMSFVEKENDSTWIIKEFDFTLKRTTPIIQTLKGSEDYAWLPDGTILMAKGSLIYKYQSSLDSTWTPVTDLINEGITTITRLAISPEGNRIAIVAVNTKNK